MHQLIDFALYLMEKNPDPEMRPSRNPDLNPLKNPEISPFKNDELNMTQTPSLSPTQNPDNWKSAQWSAFTKFYGEYLTEEQLAMCKEYLDKL